MFLRNAFSDESGRGDSFISGRKRALSSSHILRVHTRVRARCQKSGIGYRRMRDATSLNRHYWISSHVKLETATLGGISAE